MGLWLPSAPAGQLVLSGKFSSGKFLKGFHPFTPVFRLIVKCQVWDGQFWQGFHLIQIHTQYFGYFCKGFHGTIFCTFTHIQPLYFVFLPNYFTCQCDRSRQSGQPGKRAVHAGAFFRVSVCWASLADLTTWPGQVFPVPRHLVGHELPHVWGHCWPWVPLTFRHLHHLRKALRFLPGLLPD